MASKDALRLDVRRPVSCCVAAMACEAAAAIAFPPAPMCCRGYVLGAFELATACAAATAAAAVLKLVDDDEPVDRLSRETASAPARLPAAPAEGMPEKDFRSALV